MASIAGHYQFTSQTGGDGTEAFQGRVPVSVNYVLPQNLKFGPRFGWISSGHTAMEKAAVNIMPASPWKNFLDRNVNWIHDHSMAQDDFHKGPDHYINLENAEEFGHKTILPSDRTVENVGRYFNADFKKQLEHRFRDKPLNAGTLRALRPAVPQPSDENWEGQTNVLERINQSYQSLVAQLRHITEQPPGWVFTRARRIKSLEKNIGELSHYVADLHQPMHTTGYHNWPIGYVWRSEDGRDTNSSHNYFEQALFTGEELWQWRQDLEASYPPLQSKTIQNSSVLNQRLVREIERGYLTMPTLIETDRKAWDAASDDVTYFNRLRESWKPVAAIQMTRSTENLSAILLSAYETAGKPDLSRIAVKEKTMNFICWFTSLPQRIRNFFKKPLFMLGIIKPDSR